MKKIFWGVIFLLGAGALLLNQTGYLTGFGFWPIFFSIMLAAFFVNGIIKRSFGQMLFSLAFLVIVNDKMLGLEAITPWSVLGAALLACIGLNILFPKFGKGCSRHIGVHHHVSRNANGETRDGSRIAYDSSFTECVKYITGEVSEVNIDFSFGSMQVYFQDAVLADNTAKVSVDASFGSVVLYVPASYRVFVDVETSFSGCEVKGQCSPECTETLYVSGAVSFGNLEIKYV